MQKCQKEPKKLWCCNMIIKLKVRLKPAHYVVDRNPNVDLHPAQSSGQSPLPFLGEGARKVGEGYPDLAAACSALYGGIHRTAKCAGNHREITEKAPCCYRGRSLEVIAGQEGYPYGDRIPPRSGHLAAAKPNLDPRPRVIDSRDCGHECAVATSPELSGQVVRSQNAVHSHYFALPFASSRTRELGDDIKGAQDAIVLTIVLFCVNYVIRCLLEYQLLLRS